MKKEIIDIVGKINAKIKKNIIYKDYKLQYILSKNDKITDIIYSDGSTVIKVNFNDLKIKKLKKGYSILDEIFLPEIETGKQIEFMSDEAHDYMWYIIDEYYPDDLENKEGMIKYLEYCKNNQITMEYLDEKFESDPSDLLAFYDTLHDYFEVKDFQIIMSKDVFAKRCEKNYITFVLGFELLSKMMKKYQHLDCGSNYDFCYLIADRFMNSKYYKANTQSIYEMLYKYVEDKMEEITKLYINYIGTEITINIPNQRMDMRY